MKILLCIKADLNGVKSIKVAGADSHTWAFQVKNSTSDETKGCEVCCTDEVELVGSKGTANYACRFDGQVKQANLCVIPTLKGIIKAEYTAEDSGKFVPIVGFECRGLEPVGWEPRGGYVVTTEGGTTFENVSLDEKEWYEYCERSGDSVEITSLEYEW